MNNVPLLLMLVIAAEGRVTRPFRPCKDLQSCLCSDSKFMVMACEGTDLTQIPVTTFSQKVTYLALSDNRIDTVPSQAFSSYSHVRTMYLSNAGIHTIQKDAFKGVLTLEELDLSFNPLGELQPETFAGNPSLHSLVLMGNEFIHFPEGPVLVSHSLMKLDLSYCGITKLTSDAFSKLPNLKQLDLASNKLVTLGAVTLKPLPLLEELILEGNEWRCDCNLHELLSWTDTLHGRPVHYRAARCVAENGKDMMLWSFDEQGKNCSAQDQKQKFNNTLTRHDKNMEKSGLLLMSDMEIQETSVKPIDSKKPNIISVGGKETLHLMERTPEPEITIFNGAMPEITIFNGEQPKISQIYEDTDEQEQEGSTGVNEQLPPVDSSKPRSISFGDMKMERKMEAKVEKQNADNSNAGDSQYWKQDENGNEQSTLITSSTVELIFTVALVCVSIAIVVLTCLLLMYAFSAGRNVVYRLMRSDSQDSSHYEEPR